MKSPIEQRKAELKVQFNRVKSLFSFRKLKTYQDILRELELSNEFFLSLGYSDASLPLDFPLLNELFRKIEAKVFETPPEESLSPKPEETKQKSSVISELVKPLIPPKNPVQKASLEKFPFQLRNAEEVWWSLMGKPSHRAALIRANTGDGKTYVMGQLIRWFIDSGYLKDCLSPFPILFITKPSIIEQTKEVFEEGFGLRIGVDVDVYGYPTLRSSLGEQFIETEEKIVEGVKILYWKWKKHLHPRVLFLDEMQETKNDDSSQSLVCQAFNDIPDSKIKVIFASATPFSRVSGAKVFAVATRVPVDFGLHTGKPLSNHTWHEFATAIARGDYREYNKAAVKRLIKKTAPYIHGFKNVVRKHKAHNHVLYIDFRSAADQKFYMEAFERYLARQDEIQRKNLSAFLILVELNTFRMAAELVKAFELAIRAHKAVQEGKAVLVPCNFKSTIAKAVSYLYHDFGVSRKQISLIWGGDPLFNGGDNKYTKEDIHAILKKAMTAPDAVPVKVLKEITRQLEFQQSGLLDLPKELELGPQNLEQRNREVYKFQTGEALYNFYTFKAGGAGLSFHHDRESTRQRETYASPTWNEMEAIQALGRGHRINSLSDTNQYVLAYNGTIELEVVQRAAIKADCLEEVIKHSEKDYVSPEVAQILSLMGDNEAEEISAREFEQLETEE